MKTKLVVLAAAVAVSLGAWAAPTVTDITAKQRYPWNGLVDITCKVSGIEGTINGYTFVVVAVDKDSGKEYAATHCTVEKGSTGVSGWEVSGNGDYALLWDARADMGQVVIERMTVRITLEALAVSVGKVQLWEGGPYWADRNIGADKPWDYGLYFWWGDTVGYKFVNNVWVASNGSSKNFQFYYDVISMQTHGKTRDDLKREGWITTGGVLSTKHDAAHVKWGSGWRMPTHRELESLNKNCDWTWTNIRGVNGYIVRGRQAYASNSIFLPCTGYGEGYSLVTAGSRGHFWSSVSDSSPYQGSWSLDFGSSNIKLGYHGRNDGFTIRPVQ